jgi:(E)-4-hydroxy-3-methylbut-2-enyl-diphosphate synthase
MTRKVLVGGVPIGGGAPIVVQSMTNTSTKEPDARSSASLSPT